MGLRDSKAFKYVESKGWAYRTTDTQIVLETCPVSGCDNYHTFIAYLPDDKDGLWNCLKCSEHGNLYQLKAYLQDDTTDSVTSMKDVASNGRQGSPLPDVESAHRRLMEEAEGDSDDTALDYLLNERGYSMDVIERYKLGLQNDFGKRWIVIPYLQRGQCVFAKFRTIPPDEREFRGVSGREAPLFNQDVMTKGMPEVMFVEGEADCLSCLSNGLEAVVGIPGANLQKAIWLKKVDDLGIEKIYLLYDNDDVGQEAAKKMAQRIGIEKCLNIVLPKVFNETEIKDINELFVAGGTLEDFAAIKAEAKAFAVEGVFSAGEVITNIKKRLLDGGTLEPRYKFRSKELTRLVKGFDDGDLIGVLAEEKIGKTTATMNWLDDLIVDYNEPGFLYCLEMTPDRLVRKWINKVTDTDSDSITMQVVDDALDIAFNRESDFLFGYTKEISPKHVFETIRQAVRRYGVKFVVFDNLQMLCRSHDHAVQEISIIAKQFKALAMELGIVIFLIIQPHRVQEGHIVSSKNVNGSSSVAKDVDLMLCLHRNRVGGIKVEDFEAMGFMEVDESFGPEMLVRADLSRYAAGGATTLYFDGSKSKLMDMPEAQRASAAAKTPVNEIIDRVAA